MLLGEYLPAAPRPHGKRDKQKGSKGAHMGHSAQTHVPPLGPPVASVHLRSRWPGARQMGLQGPASAPRTPGTTPALRRWGSDVPEVPCLLPGSGGSSMSPVPTASLGTRQLPSAALTGQVLVTQACAERHSTGPNGKPAGGHWWARPRLGPQGQWGRFSGQGGSAGPGALGAAPVHPRDREPRTPSLPVPLAAPGAPPSLARRPLSSVEAVTLPAGEPVGPCSTPPLSWEAPHPSRTAAPACRHGCWSLLGTELSRGLSPCPAARGEPEQDLVFDPG